MNQLSTHKIDHEEESSRLLPGLQYALFILRNNCRKSQRDKVGWWSDSGGVCWQIRLPVNLPLSQVCQQAKIYTTVRSTSAWHRIGGTTSCVQIINYMGRTRQLSVRSFVTSCTTAAVMQHTRAQKLKRTPPLKTCHVVLQL